MDSASDAGAILVTGACGHVGQELCRILRNAECRFLPVDLEPNKAGGVLACDLRSQSDVLRLFQGHLIRVVIHLAGVLPSAFNADPLAGADINLGGSCELLRQAAASHVRRFIFASSMSVYGSSCTRQPVTEKDLATPDDLYGASKLTVELIGQALSRQKIFEFVALRIARILGPGIKKTSSPWRSQIFTGGPLQELVCVPFAPEAILSLVHVEDVARMLFTLAETSGMSSSVYNSPVEIWEGRRLKETVEELRGVRVELGPQRSHGGPICDGSRFAREFGFQLRSLRDHLSSYAGSSPTSFP